MPAPAVAMPVEARSEQSMWSEHSRWQRKKRNQWWDKPWQGMEEDDGQEWQWTPAEVEVEAVEAVGGGADEMDVVASVIPHIIDVEQMLMAPGPTSRLRKKTSMGGAKSIDV
jgi:hypothetical protein